MDTALRLPLRFDPAGLWSDLQRILADDWITHFNTGLYSGDWSGIALRGAACAAHPVQALHPAPGTTAFADQPVLDGCPSIRAVMADLQCPLLTTRLLRLGPGAVVEEHVDHELGRDFGEVRLHVPIQTSVDVDFRARGQRIVMEAGELWYLDASQPHSVANHGDRARIHLVIDCTLNAWLSDLLDHGAPVA